VRRRGSRLFPGPGFVRTNLRLVQTGGVVSSRLAGTGAAFAAVSPSVVRRCRACARTARLPPGEARDAIVAAGIGGWACITGKGPNGCGVLLGFDAVTHASRIMPAGELSLLRTVLDTIVNVLGRRSLEQEQTRIEARLEQTR